MEIRGMDGFRARIRLLVGWSAKKSHAPAWQSAELFQHKANLHPTNAGPMVFAGSGAKQIGFRRFVKTRRDPFGKIDAE